MPDILVVESQAGNFKLPKIRFVRPTRTQQIDWMQGKESLVCLQKGIEKRQRIEESVPVESCEYTQIRQFY